MFETILKLLMLSGGIYAVGGVFLRFQLHGRKVLTFGEAFFNSFEAFYFLKAVYSNRNKLTPLETLIMYLCFVAEAAFIVLFVVAAMLALSLVAQRLLGF